MIKHWINEAIRRRVFRTAGFYIVGTWVLIQVFDLVFEAWGLPDTAMRYVFLAAVFGFPLAVVFGWKFDLTAKGIVRTAAIDEDASHQLKPVDYAVLAVLIAVTGFGLYRVADFTIEEAGIEQTTSPVEVQADEVQKVNPNSVAVMPFVNMSDDPGNAYFSDGISEELLNSLARVEGLGVTARTSAFALRDENLDMREIARRLSVAHVVEGSVRKAGNRVRITAQLIRADDGFHLWSQTYDRDLEDIFAIQTEVAELIATALKPELGVDEKSRMMAGSTKNVEALDEYLKGMSLMETRIATNIESSLVHFRRAISLDPRYTLAYSGVASAFVHLNSYGGLSWPEVIEGGLEYAEKAIELSPDLGGAYSTLAYYKLHQGQQDVAFELHLKAIALDPSNPDILRSHASFLRHQFGRYAEAVELTRRAVELDPLAPIAHVNYATAMAVNGDPEAAIKEYKKAISLNSEFAVAFISMSGALDSLGEMGKKAWAIKRSVNLNPGSVQNLYGLADTLLKFGLNEESEFWARQAIEISPEFFNVYFTLFNSLSRQGKFDEARQVRDQMLGMLDSPEFSLRTKLMLMASEGVSGETFSNYLDSLDWQALAQTAIELEDAETAVYLAFLHKKAGSGEPTGELLEMAGRVLGDPDTIYRVAVLVLKGESEAAVTYLEEFENTGTFKDAGFVIQHDPILTLLEDNPDFIAFRQRMLDVAALSLAEYEANLETKLPDDWIELEAVAQ